MPDPAQSQAWKALQQHYQQDIAHQPLKHLFASGGNNRFDALSYQNQGMLLDLSKQRLTPKTMGLLMHLAQERQLTQAIDNLLAGKIVNHSEQRPALHTALRQTTGTFPRVAGKDTQALIQANLDHMQNLVEQLHTGQWLGFDGQPIRTIVNIGVGGSDIGPRMVSEALDEFRANSQYPLTLLFVSCMDGSELAAMLSHLDQSSTLFILASKTFTTIDTLANAQTARAWLRQKISNDEMIGLHHLIGCSAFPERMASWGIPATNQVALWDWVGGRYSLWSGIGLPVALKLGMQGFKQLLAGAEAMDQHFSNTPLCSNLPVLLAMAGIWNINILGLKAHVILPYDGRLTLLPNYLSQLAMESNGKSVTNTGEAVIMATSPIIWGDVGANAQHAFFQLLHQGTVAFYADFIVSVKRQPCDHYSQGIQIQWHYQQSLNLANCIAQSRVLMMGDHALPRQSPHTQSPERLYPGNHGTTTIMIDELTPHSLGQLIALYEHKVYVQAVIWDINPFDQWGVELGKHIAKTTLSCLQQPQGQPLLHDSDASTNGLLAYVREQRKIDDELMTEHSASDIEKLTAAWC